MSDLDTDTIFRCGEMGPLQRRKVKPTYAVVDEMSISLFQLRPLAPFPLLSSTPGAFPVHLHAIAITALILHRVILWSYRIGKRSNVGVVQRVEVQERYEVVRRVNVLWRGSYSI